MSKSVVFACLLSGLFIPTTYAQSFFSSAPASSSAAPVIKPAASSGTMSAQEYRDKVHKMSQQYDSSINKQVKSMMPPPPAPIPVTMPSPAASPNVVAAPAAIPAPAPVAAPQTSISNQPTAYPTAPVNPSVSGRAPSQPAPASGDVYTGFQGTQPSGTTNAPSAPATIPTNNSSSGWNVRY